MLSESEQYYPLRVYVCDECFLVQIDEYAISSDIFNAGYVYFSSYSDAFVSHAKNYVEHITKFHGINKTSMVYEAASNDGYLLQFFLKNGIPCCGIEPSKSVADVAISKGIPTEIEFFTASSASQLVYHKGHADLFIGNNVMAHVPDLNDFIAGIKTILKPTGIATIEFPHLLPLIDNLEFDTIYHEHYSYFSLLSIKTAFKRHGLDIFHVDELPIHGGSLRIYAANVEENREIGISVSKILKNEIAVGLDDMASYTNYQSKVDSLCCDFIKFLIDKKEKGAKIIGYGAAAKGNTLLNYCGIKPYLIDFVSDITPAKQGKFLPGSHIPVYDEDMIRQYKPDYIVILPWNWKESILKRLDFAREWGAKFVTTIPKIEIY